MEFYFFNTVSLLLLLCKNGIQENKTSATPEQIYPRILERTEYTTGYNFSKGNASPIVSTKAGQLEGFVMRSIKGRSIYAFEGIPYAETTGGTNRFELAKPKEAWPGVRPAKQAGAPCLQRHPAQFLQIVGSEDCLFINIYVPSDPINQGFDGLPVIVWLHGGSWFFGSGAEYGPLYLLEHNVIFITLNYRLGIFGFLSTGDENLPGNLGHKDQRSALQYIHENVASFGGDPTHVTIAGISSGAASVHYHILARSSHPFFSGAISMSGNAFCPWTLMTKPMIETRNKKLASATNCSLSNTNEFVACLKKIDGFVLVRKLRSLMEFPGAPIVPLGVVIEEDGPGAFLTEHPDEIYANNRAAKVPYICTGTSNEIPLSLGRMEPLQIFYNRIFPMNRRISWDLWRYMLPHMLEYRFTAKDPSRVTTKIEEFYFKGKGRDQFLNFTVMGQLMGDRMFGYGTHKTLQAHSQIAPTYSYFYGYHGRKALTPNLLGVNPYEFGVAHADDINVVLNISNMTSHNYKPTDPDYTIVHLLTSMWYNFATTRVPLYTDKNGNIHRIWDPITDSQNIRVLQINRDVKMIPEQYTERLKFWETLGLDDLKPIFSFN